MDDGPIEKRSTLASLLISISLSKQNPYVGIVSDLYKDAGTYQGSMANEMTNPTGNSQSM